MNRFRVGLVAGAGLLAFFLTASRLTDPVELPLRDLCLRLLPRYPARRVAAVVIDEAAISHVGSWPWPRQQLARLVRGLWDAGAGGVVVDILLPEERPGDDELAESLRAGPSVLGAGLDESRGWVRPVRTLRSSAREAHVSFELDGDGVVRSFLTTKQRDDVSLPALSAAAASMADGRPIPVAKSLRPDFRTPSASIPVAGAADVLSGRASGHGFRGRFVFVGVTAAGLGDRIVSPLSPGSTQEPGVLVQASATESLLRRGLLRPLPAWLAGLAAAAVGASGIVAGRRPDGWRGGAFLPALLVPPVAAVLLAAGLEVPMATIAGTALLAATASVLASARRTEERAGEAARQLSEELGDPGTGPPLDRVRRLEEIASALVARRREETETRRVLAHELKTPLTSVRGLAQLLESFDLSPDERKRVASMVVTETARLSAMVESLLDIEKLRLRDFETVAAAVPLSELVRTRAETLGRGAGRDVRLSVQPGVTVRGDRALLERVLDNLLGNAFKFSAAPAPVSVRLETRDGGVLLDVADRGPGVPAAERELIFGPFQRGAAGRDAAGLGLGLALVRQVATWHRGLVEVVDSPEGGATFRVRLPKADDPPVRKA